MEKKGDFLNQIAIISDLIEKVNANIESSTLVYELKDEEFNRIYKLIEKKTGQKVSAIDDAFNIKIGNVDIIFNKSNV